SAKASWPLQPSRARRFTFEPERIFTESKKGSFPCRNERLLETNENQPRRNEEREEKSQKSFVLFVVDSLRRKRSVFLLHARLGGELADAFKRNGFLIARFSGAAGL